MRMRNWQIFIAFNLILAIAIHFLLAAQESVVPLVSSSPAINGWVTVLDPASNAYFAWRSDPFLSAIVSRLFPLSYAADPLLAGISALVFFVGLSLVLFSISEFRRPIFATLGSASTLFLLYSLVGKNSFFFGSLCWLPWLTVVLLQLLGGKGGGVLVKIIFLLFISLRISQSANQLGVLLATLSVVAVLAIGPTSSYLRNARALLILSLIVATPSLYSLAEAPLPNFPDYPFLAQVVADDGLPGMVRPLVGPDWPIPVIDREFFKSLAYPALICLSILGVLIWTSTRLTSKSEKSPLLLFACAIAGLLLADCIFPEHISQILPLQSVTRLIPGYSLLPLTLPLLGFCVFCFTIELARDVARGFKAGAYLTLGCFVGAGILISPWNLQNNKIVSPELKAAFAADTSDQKKVIASPSLAVLRQRGSAMLAIRDQINTLTFSPISNFQPSFNASHQNQPAQLKKLIDNKESSRWSPSKARQDGDEWLYIELGATTVIKAIELDPGRFAADFPRGLEIRISPESCAAAIESCSSWATVFHESPWRGVLKFTPQGFPFFAGQSEVKIYFAQPLQAKSILVRQIGKEAHFDWSVSVIRLAQ